MKSIYKALVLHLNIQCSMTKLLFAAFPFIALTCSTMPQRELFLWFWTWNWITVTLICNMPYFLWKLRFFFFLCDILMPSEIPPKDSRKKMAPKPFSYLGTCRSPKWLVLKNEHAKSTTLHMTLHNALTHHTRGRHEKKSTNYYMHTLRTNELILEPFYGSSNVVWCLLPGVINFLLFLLISSKLFKNTNCLNFL